MARIEDIPDDFDEALQIHDSTPKKSTKPADDSVSDGFHPSLPPAAAEVRAHSAEDIVKMLGKSPLFMTSLEDAGEEGMKPPYVSLHIVLT